VAKALIPQEVVALVEVGPIGLHLRDREVQAIHLTLHHLKAAMVETVLVLTLVEAAVAALLQLEQTELQAAAVPVAQVRHLLFLEVALLMLVAEVVAPIQVYIQAQQVVLVALVVVAQADLAVAVQTELLELLIQAVAVVAEPETAPVLRVAAQAALAS